MVQKAVDLPAALPVRTGGRAPAPGRRPFIGHVVLFGGGSGGHLVPGMALAERLVERHRGCRVVLFRTRRAIESRVLGCRDLDTVDLELRPPSGGPGASFTFARQCLGGVRRIREYLARSQTDVAVGLGGYPSVPGVLAARLEGVPLVLLEQNAVPGKVNRLLGPLADWIAVPGVDSLRGFGSWTLLTRTLITGSPLRGSVLRARRWRQTRAPENRRREVGASGRRVLLVVGGSQGAHAINRVVAETLGRLPWYREKIFCIHLTGEADKEKVEDSYRKAGWMAKVSAYQSHLPALMAASDLVIGRAGGTTLAEVAALGVPSFLVPYPGHADGHQLRNARELESRGACRIVEEARFNSEAVLDALEILFDDARLEAMGRGALELGRTDGADRVIDLMEDLLSGRPVRTPAGGRSVTGREEDCR